MIDPHAVGHDSQQTPSNGQCHEIGTDRGIYLKLRLNFQILKSLNVSFVELIYST